MSDLEYKASELTYFDFNNEAFETDNENEPLVFKVGTNFALERKCKGVDSFLNMLLCKPIAKIK